MPPMYELKTVAYEDSLESKSENQEEEGKNVTEIDQQTEERMKLLVMQAFDAISTPCDVEQLLGLVTDDIININERECLEGMEECRSFLLRILPKWDRIANHKFRLESYTFHSLGGGSFEGFYRWKYTHKLVGCAAFFSYVCCCGCGMHMSACGETEVRFITEHTKLKICLFRDHGILKYKKKFLSSNEAFCL